MHCYALSLNCASTSGRPCAPPLPYEDAGIWQGTAWSRIQPFGAIGYLSSQVWLLTTPAWPLAAPSRYPGSHRGQDWSIWILSVSPVDQPAGRANMTILNIAIPSSRRNSIFALSAPGTAVLLAPSAPPTSLPGSQSLGLLMPDQLNRALLGLVTLDEYLPALATRCALCCQLYSIVAC